MDDGVANSGYSHNNDRPTLTLANGKTVLLDRYPANQPGFAEWDARLQKDFALGERYRIQLSGDFYNLTNRGNVYSNPDTSATLDYCGNLYRAYARAISHIRRFSRWRGRLTLRAVYASRASNPRCKQRHIAKSTRLRRAARRSLSRPERSSFSDDLGPPGKKAVFAGSEQFFYAGRRLAYGGPRCRRFQFIRRRRSCIRAWESYLALA